MASEQFKTDFVNAHNEFRAKHGCPPVKLNDTISRFSQSWADHLAQIDQMQHSSGSGYGENLYASWSSDPNTSIGGRAAVENWYSEIKDYNFGQEQQNISKVGHFSQVVWKSSNEVGVGIAKSKSNWIYVVGNYKPQGNFIGRFVENVPPPLK